MKANEKWDFEKQEVEDWIVTDTWLAKAPTRPLSQGLWIIRYQHKATVWALCLKSTMKDHRQELACLQVQLRGHSEDLRKNERSSNSQHRAQNPELFILILVPAISSLCYIVSYFPNLLSSVNPQFTCHHSHFSVRLLSGSSFPCTFSRVKSIFCLPITRDDTLGLEFCQSLFSRES